MSVGGQFTGLDMKELIGGPLSAAADASVQLAQSTADFINKVGFDEQKKVRTVAFGYARKTENPDGSFNNDEMNVNVPILAIVPIPNLQVDEVNILFDMEVKESEKSESSLDGGGTFTSSVNFGVFKATVSGSVSTHSSNTRSSDNSAKYHVDVRAANHGTPEGLSRVLDMMAACVAPETLGSKAVDENGKALEGQRRQRAEKVKALQAEIMSMNKKVNAAKDSLKIAIDRIRQTAQSKQNQYLLYLNTALEQAGEDEEKTNSLAKIQEQVTYGWNDFLNTLSSKVELIQGVSTEDAARLQNFYQTVPLYGVKSDATQFKFKAEEEDAVALSAVFQSALKAQDKVVEMQDAVNKKQDEYNTAMYGG